MLTLEVVLGWPGFPPPEVLGRSLRKNREISPRLRNLSGPTPHYRAIPFRDSIAKGGIAHFCLGFVGYRASITEIPFLSGGVSHLVVACSPRRKRSEKGASHPIAHVERRKTP